MSWFEEEGKPRWKDVPMEMLKGKKPLGGSLNEGVEARI